ncbi:MAG: flavodoxin family protein [Candidatus Bathyarchaeia archaeon]|jgi:flavodoxin
MKILVVYYSRTGKTRFVAETIASQLGADLEEIVDLKNRQGKLGWILAGKDASRKSLTEIASLTKAPAAYDLIVIGTPIWAWSPTPAVRTYIKQNSLSGKMVALFYTSDGDIRQADQKTKELLQDATVVSTLWLVSPLSNKEESQKKIADWCKTLPLQP